MTPTIHPLETKVSQMAVACAYLVSCFADDFFTRLENVKAGCPFPSSHDGTRILDKWI